ncbi:O-antigen ligase domain-containing protein [Pseudomonas sp. CK-NBRI-02]|uniref:O-antigen ligase family protein n=1 Tax=Pseudomonas sp. CK-NBRI-02 TaxID=2249759 RepID=UPI0003A9322F|nr:O-antigen ligase family protein [Pseudomonas sp. CK-NBRI-02]TYO83315.1 O-antigen ligase domain-containing protein [Pseudomonas sp. CK-NBRI-02]
MTRDNQSTLNAQYLLFLLLFPGTILYYVAITSGVFPPLPAGYFGIVSAGALAMLFPMYAWAHIKTLRINATDLSYMLFLLYFLLIATINRSSSDDYMFAWHLTAIAQSISVFLICKGVAGTYSRPRILLLFSWIIVSACMMYYTVGGRFSLREMSDLNHIPSYQTFALCYFLLSFLIVYQTSKRWVRLPIILVSFACLYINGARSEFLGFVLFAAIFELLLSKNKAIPFIAAISIAMLSILVASSGIVELPESRITNLIDLQNDNSSRERERIASEGVERIMENPIFGDYGNYEKGEYIHNILSAWHDLGLAGFLFVIAIVGAPTLKLLIMISSGQRLSKQSLAIFALLVCSALLLFAGKYFTYLMIPAALGFYSSSQRIHTTL